jgi:hypothetical protein
MKKPKLQLDKAAIQEFFIQNVEKIVFGVFTLVFLYMVYAAIAGVKPYDKTPGQLMDTAKQNQSKLDNAESDKGLVVKDYDVQAKQNSTPISEKPYGSLANWDPAIFPKRELRDKPALYAVQGLRGTAGAGAFQMVQEAAAGENGQAAVGGTKVQGQRWVVLTGLVPYDKQEQAFIDALKNAGPTNSYDATRDTPYYWGYEVQRVEVASPGDEAKPDWAKAKTILSGEAVKKAEKQWGLQQQSPEVVAAEYLFTPYPKGLAFPLGFLAKSTWGESVGHLPEIPIQEVGVGQGMGMNRGGRGMLMPPPLQGGRPALVRPGGAGAGTPPGGDDAPDPFGGAAEAPGPAGAAAAEGAVAGAGTSPYLLFRFFDFDVEPGKRYAYRVRLGLQNPNYKDLKPKVNIAGLKNSQLAEDRILKTKWSDEEDAASVVVSVPVDTRIVAAVSVTTKASQPIGRILVSKWLRGKGLEVSKEFDVVRGQVADFPDEITKLVNDAGMGGMGAGGRGGIQPVVPGMLIPGMDGRGGPVGRGGPAVGRDGRPIGMPIPGADMRRPPAGVRPLPAAMDSNRPFKVNYFTRAIVLDLRGGELLHGRKVGGLRLPAPGDILLVDADGNLIVHDELDDLAAYERIRPRNAAGGPAADAEPIVRPKAARGGVTPKGGGHDKLANPDGTTRKRPKPGGER